MDAAALLDVLRRTVRAVRGALDQVDDLRAPGERPGQYRLDLVADAAALVVLHGAGLSVLSEESGTTNPSSSTATGPSGDLLAVLDPIDGSTNASLGLPWFATSICVLDRHGPLVGVVTNQATGVEYGAVREGGAWREDRLIRPSGREELATSVIGVSGLPRRWPGWAQFRALGAASLDLCAVAEGVLDGYMTAGASTLNSWDYLAGVLICSEAGAAVGERSGHALVVRDASSRQPVAAATHRLSEQLQHAEI
jgi:myo-inositol-1(or 4)-monophosphatase